MGRRRRPFSRAEDLVLIWTALTGRDAEAVLNLLDGGTPEPRERGSLLKRQKRVMQTDDATLETTAEIKLVLALDERFPLRM